MTSTRSCCRRPSAGSASCRRSTARRTGSPRTSTAARCAPACAAFAPRSPEALDALAEFAGQLVDRYGPDGTLWGDAPRGRPDSRSAPGRSGTSRTRRPSTSRRPTRSATRRSCVAGSVAITRARPGRRGDPGRHVRHAAAGEPPSAWHFLRQLYGSTTCGTTSTTSPRTRTRPTRREIEPQVERLHDEIVRGRRRPPGSGSPRSARPPTRARTRSSAVPRARPSSCARRSSSSSHTAWTGTSRASPGTRGGTLSDPNQCDWCPGSGLFEEDSLTPKPAWEEFVSFTGGT